MESKNDKFKRIKDVRLPKALKSIDLLGNLGASDYEASDEEKGDLIMQLQDMVDEVVIKLGLKEVEGSGLASRQSRTNETSAKDQRLKDHQDSKVAEFNHGAFVMKSGNSKFSPMLNFEVGNGKIIASEISDMSNQLMSANYSLQLVLNKLGLAHKPEQVRGITDE